MNRLNNKLLWILLCISNNGLGMDFGMDQLLAFNVTFSSVMGMNPLAITSKNIPIFYVSPRDFNTYEEKTMSITYPDNRTDYLPLLNSGIPRVKSADQHLLPYFITDIPKCRHKKKPAPSLVYNNWKVEQLVSIIPNAKLEKIKSKLEDLPELVHKASVLHAAIEHERHDCVALLLAYNANPNVLIGVGDSPLHRVRVEKTAQLLVDHGAYVHHKNDKGETSFFSAIVHSCLNVASVLHKAGAHVNDGDNNNNTPLHYAVMNLGPEVIKFLLYHEADPNQPNNQGITPYQMILNSGGDVFETFQECTKVFFAINATVEANKAFTVMNLLACDGRQLKNILRLDTSGHCSSDIVIAEDLLQQCDNAVWDELADDFSPCSAELLWLAKMIKERSRHRKDFLKELRKNNFFMAKQLVQINPYILHVREGEFDSASDLFKDKFLSVAVSDPGYRHIKELLHGGFDLNIRDDRGMTALCQLIMDDTVKIKYADLLKVGVSVNTLDIYGKTPLSYAVLLGDENKVERLLQYGAVVHVDMITKSSTFPFRELLCEVFNEQRCYVCKDHPEELSNIPCIKQHNGHFICKDCYDFTDSQCPVCQRILDKYGM